MTSTEQRREEFLQERWKKLQIERRTALPSKKCDILRCLMTQVEHARALNVLDPDSSFELMDHYLETYASIVDAPVESSGVDNYAEGALSVAAGVRNESKAWASSFNKENIMKFDCVQSFIKETKLARALDYPECGNDQILHLFPKPSPHTNSKMVQPSVSMAIKKTCATGSRPDCKSSQKPQELPWGTSSLKPMGPSKSSNIPNSKLMLNDASRSSAPLNPGLDSSLQYQGHHLFNQSHNQDGMGEKKDFWSLGSNAKPGNMVPQEAGRDWEVESSDSRQRFAQNSNPTGQPKPYTKFAPNKPFPPYRKPLKRHCPDDDEEMEEENVNQHFSAFKTAAEQLAINNQKKHGGGNRTGGGGYYNSNPGGTAPPSNAGYGNQKRSLGTRRGPSSKFVPPVIKDDDEDGGTLVRKGGSNKSSMGPEEPVDERLKNIDPKMIELISNEIMDHGPEVTWDDIAGLEFAKKTITEIVVWPMLRPDIFTGLRGPPKGLLLFGPPGTGKTLIGKCIASQSKSTFFSISASSLTSKWVGEGEKMVRALFAVSRVHQPAVIFIDEIDSLLSQRTDGEHEASRRIKTEFLVQLDGATTGSEDKILVVGATNRPQEIDEAARRRFVKRLYIPLPEGPARKQIVVNLMNTQPNELTDEDMENICQQSIGYSGADMANLCREAALGPIRSISLGEIESITADQVRPIVYTDFRDALMHVRPSVSDKDLDVYLDWNRQYGSWGK